MLVGGLNKFERIFLSNLFLNRLNEMQIKGYELNSAEILSKSSIKEGLVLGAIWCPTCIFKMSESNLRVRCSL